MVDVPHSEDDNGDIAWTHDPEGWKGQIAFGGGIPDPIENYAEFSYWLSPSGVFARVKGLEVTVIIDNGWDQDWNAVYWGDGENDGDINWWARAEGEHDYSPTYQDGHGARTKITHRYAHGGTYSLNVFLAGPGPENMAGKVQRYYTTTLELTDEPVLNYGTRGYAFLEDDEASTVRRAGRVVWSGSRVMPQSWGHVDDEDRQEQAQDSAAKMRRRVRGRERRRSFSIVPAPWLMPGDVIEAELSDGVATQKHVVESVTIPLAPTPQGQTVTTVHHDLL